MHDFNPGSSHLRTIFIGFMWGGWMEVGEGGCDAAGSVTVVLCMFVSSTSKHEHLFNSSFFCLHLGWDVSFSALLWVA